MVLYVLLAVIVECVQVSQCLFVCLFDFVNSVALLVVFFGQTVTTVHVLGPDFGPGIYLTLKILSFQGLLTKSFSPYFESA